MEIGPCDIRWRRDLLAAGFAEHEVRQRVRAGELVGVRRGAYLVGGALPGSMEARHLVQIRAALPGLAADAVVSHVSAAVVHGLPIWGVPLDRVRVTRSRRAGARITPTLHVHAAPLNAGDVVEVGGVPVTSVARTVVDVARALPFEQAVVIADGALYRQLVTPSDLDLEMQCALRRPGGPAARRVLEFSDGRSESPGESRSRVALQWAGLPVPLLQWEVRSRHGHQLGRVDFGWPALRTVGESDGRVKYGRLLGPGQEPGDVVFAEKLREDEIRDEGLRMVRWTWADLNDFALVAGRIRQAYRAA